MTSDLSLIALLLILAAEYNVKETLTVCLLIMNYLIRMHYRFICGVVYSEDMQCFFTGQFLLKVW